MPDAMEREAEIDAYLRAGDGIAARLETIRYVLDERFVAAGNILIQTIDVSADLISSFEMLDTVFNARVVERTVTDLRVAAAKLCTLPACHALHVDGITRLNRVREAFARDLSEMRCSLVYMQAFAMKATGLADQPGMVECEEDPLGAEICACVARGNDEIKALESDVGTLQRELGAAADQGEVLGRQIAALLPAVPDDLTASAEIMREQYAKIAATAGSAARIARDLHGCVARILEALQIGDITRQRVEHVQACIIKMEADQKAHGGESDDAVFATGFALLAEQLVDVGEQFAREVDAVAANMKEMAADAAALLKLYHIAFAREGGEGVGFLQRLAARVDAAIKLVEGIEAVDQAAIEAGISTARTALRLTGRVENIRALRTALQDMAGKAALYCRQSGERWLPMSRIAQEIRGHGKELEEAAAVGLGTLDKLIQLTSVMTEAGAAIRIDESKSVAAREALTVAASRLREARDLTAVNVTEITERGDAVQETLALSGERLDFLVSIGTELAAVSRHAASLAQGAYDPSGRLPPSLAALLEAISETYTMAQERHIHRAFAERYGLASWVPPARETADDVLF